MFCAVVQTQAICVPVVSGSFGGTPEEKEKPWGVGVALCQWKELIISADSNVTITKGSVEHASTVAYKM